MAAGLNGSTAATALRDVDRGDRVRVRVQARAVVQALVLLLALVLRAQLRGAA